MGTVTSQLDECMNGSRVVAGDEAPDVPDVDECGKGKFMDENAKPDDDKFGE